MASPSKRSQRKISLTFRVEMNLRTLPQQRPGTADRHLLQVNPSRPQGLLRALGPSSGPCRHRSTLETTSHTPRPPSALLLTSHVRRCRWPKVTSRSSHMP